MVDVIIFKNTQKCSVLEYFVVAAVSTHTNYDTNTIPSDFQ